MRNTIKKILKENDFDWIGETNPVSKGDIISKLRQLSDVGYRRNLETSQITETIYNLALNEEQFDLLFRALYHLADYSYSEGIDVGHQEGYSEGERDGYRYGRNDGYDEARSEIEDDVEDGFNRGYDEGYDEGMNDGYKKGYDEGVEVTYYKAFEEGRAYEAGIEVEDLERRESGFDPSEYDEDYDENY